MPSTHRTRGVYTRRTDGVHDMGGMHGFGAVVTPGSEAVSHDEWELRVFAISTLVGIEGLGSGSGRAIREEMPPAEYLRAGYYERWLWSTEQRLLRRGTIAADEIDAWAARLGAGEEAPWREDADAGALHHSEREQGAGEVGRPFVGLGVGDALDAAVAGGRDDEVVRTVLGDQRREHRGDGAVVRQRDRVEVTTGDQHADHQMVQLGSRFSANARMPSW